MDLVLGLGALPAREKTKRPSALTFHRHVLIITLSGCAELQGLQAGGVRLWEVGIRKGDRPAQSRVWLLGSEDGV